MIIEIPSISQIRKEVAKAVDKREFKMQRLIDYLQKRILKLEDEVNILRLKK